MLLILLTCTVSTALSVSSWPCRWTTRVGGTLGTSWTYCLLLEDTQQVGRQMEARERVGEKKKVVVGFFVGRVPVAEATALRFLTQQEESTVEHLVDVSANKYQAGVFKCKTESFY